MYEIQKVVDGHYCVGFGNVIINHKMQHILQYKNSCDKTPMPCVARIDGENRDMYVFKYGDCVEMFFFDGDKEFLGMYPIWHYDWVTPPEVMYHCNKYHSYFSDEQEARRAFVSKYVFLNNTIIGLLKRRYDLDLPDNSEIIEYLQKSTQKLISHVLNANVNRVDDKKPMSSPVYELTDEYRWDFESEV